MYQSSINQSIPQAPYGTVSYSIIGDDAAPGLFFIDSASGRINIQQSFSTDSADQYRVRAFHRKMFKE